MAERERRASASEARRTVSGWALLPRRQGVVEAGAAAGVLLLDDDEAADEDDSPPDVLLLEEEEDSAELLPLEASDAAAAGFAGSVSLLAVEAVLFL